ncbi:nitrous oxide reductase family maturation protein NosD [Rhizobium herbae]
MSRLTTIMMAAFLAAITSAAAADRVVTPSDGDTLSRIIDDASAGDRIILRAGDYSGPVVIRKTLTVEGDPGSAIVGNGTGTVVTIDAPAVIVRGIGISGSGMDLEAMDSGIFATQAATGALIEGNVLTGNLYGIYVHGAAKSLTSRNRVIGLTDGRLSESGNGVTVWNAPGAKVLDNDISFGRDGIATNASKRNVFSGNRFTNVRFAIHYMYTNDSEISGNVSIGNLVGYAIMFSSRLKIVDNVSDGDRDHGLLLNFANNSLVSGNTVSGHLQPESRWTLAGTRVSSQELLVDDSASQDEGDQSGFRPGPEKCVFIYNANKNRILDNQFNGCAIGVHFTAGSEGNVMTGNAFVNNRNQVKYAGTRFVDWSVDGRGNFWSDNQAFDLDGDGIGDNPYRPNDLMDKVLWTSPQAKVLTTSPAVQVIRWAQAQFPALLPGGVVDSHPLMAPPAHREVLQ